MMLSPSEGLPQETAKVPDIPLRTVPHNLQAEQALLGALMVFNNSYDRISDMLSPANFFEPLHGTIYETIAKLISTGRLASPITLKPFVENMPPIDSETTVPQYLGRLVRYAGTYQSVKDYARTILELSQRRGLILAAEDMLESAYDATADGSAAAIIEDAEHALYKIAESGSTDAKAEVSFGESARLAVEMAQEAHRRQGAVGLSTGLADLDGKLGGLCRSDLIILAGRPSMGKTALALNMAWSIASNGHPDTNGVMAPAPVAFFSLEMGSEQLSTRVLSFVSGVASHKMRYGTTSTQDLETIARAQMETEKTPLIIDPRGGINIAQLMTRARRMRRRYGIELLIVDYLQLLSGGGRFGNNRTQELTEITTGLKTLAKELNIPVLALSQLSRQVEVREDKRPQLSDLRESGSIEQDADVVMFVYRDEYYIERAKPHPHTPEFSDWQRRLQAAANKAEVIIGKQRHGPVGTVEVGFDGQKTQFFNLAQEDQLS